MTLPSFEAFYEAVNGVRPFPWQGRAAAKLAGRATFKLGVPTGLGKSSMVDAAVWAASQGAWRRIIFVVDRRLVVDEVYERAQRLKTRLESDESEALREVRERLGDIQVARLRGGVFGDDDWVLYPERLSIVLTTVDQLGSRLLFRGYGVSPKRWSMHAGFFSDDALVIVDEAHLSTPFLETLAVLERAGAKIATCPMSATLAPDIKDPALCLDSSDFALPTVKRRLGATKLAQLREVGSSDKELTKAAIDALVEAISADGVRKVGMVFNRVKTARAVFDAVRAKNMRCTLLTGRIRATERDQRVQEVLAEAKAGRLRDDNEQPFVVIATQTIEVGADLDFDALITECASLSALRQRFGRLDRLGLLGCTHGWILKRTSPKPDPIYGDDWVKAWEWLSAVAEGDERAVDFGLQALDALLAKHPAPIDSQRHAATLLPAHIQVLSQTGPYAPTVDLTGWLHGPRRQAEDVTLVWRDDLGLMVEDDWPSAICLLPPMTREGLQLPVQTVRQFLAGKLQSDSLSDLSGEEPEQVRIDEGRPVLRWRGQDDCSVVGLRDIRPGDTLVIPSSYGGCDAWGWAPEARQPVADVADQCQLDRIESGGGRRFALRLVDGRWSYLADAADSFKNAVAHLRQLQERVREGADFDELVEQEITDAREDLLRLIERLPEPFQQALKGAVIEAYPQGLVLLGRGTDDLDDLVETGRSVSLEAHHADVAGWADKLGAGAEQQHLSVLVEAAAKHDAGKAEMRMQILLYGNPALASLGPLLAKSKFRSREHRLSAYRASGLPRGFRHEFASLDLAELDDPLVRHLVATHHGFGRPWLRPCADTTAPGADYASLQRHWLKAWSDLLKQYDPWLLSRLEWRLRAADARASIEEATQAEGETL